MDTGFLVPQMLVAAPGLALVAGRDSGAKGLLLSYGKFVHGSYGDVALLRYSLERARPASKFSSE
jgi:citrate/tricarballylate utilization protein